MLTPPGHTEFELYFAISTAYFKNLNLKNCNHVTGLKNTEHLLPVYTTK